MTFLISQTTLQKHHFEIKKLFDINFKVYIKQTFLKFWVYYELWPLKAWPLLLKTRMLDQSFRSLFLLLANDLYRIKSAKPARFKIYFLEFFRIFLPNPKSFCIFSSAKRDQSFSLALSSRNFAQFAVLLFWKKSRKAITITKEVLSLLGKLVSHRKKLYGMKKVHRY